MNRKHHEPLIHLVKRVEASQKLAWSVRIAAFLISFFLCAVISSIMSGRGSDFFFSNFFKGVFGTERLIWNLFHDTAIMLLIALAVTPCFKMKFWNIGGEGQILMGALGCSVIVNSMAGSYPHASVIVLSLILSLAFGVAWAVIPAIFKAKWNTNETLLTLMMNYIAVCLVDYFIKKVASSGTGILNFSNKVGLIGPVGNEFILKIVVAVVVTLIMGIYLKYTKHGYELTVVGESVNTARYIGINTKKVIIRTLVLCGVLCGLIGFLLVSATDYGLNSDSTVGGKGFTGVLISWLGHFNPLGIALGSFVYSFFFRGATRVGTIGRLGGSFPDVLCGVFLFVLIASEFFINYQIKFRNGDKIREYFAPVVNAFAKLKKRPAVVAASENNSTESDGGEKDLQESIKDEILSEEVTAESVSEEAPKEVSDSAEEEEK